MLLWFGKKTIMNWLDRQWPLGLREHSGDAELRVNILDCKKGGRPWPHLHLWGAISRSFALPAVNRLSLMTRLFTRCHFVQVLFAFWLLYWHIKSLTQQGWDRNNIQEFWNLLVSLPLCRCTPVARISLKVCMFSRIFAQRYHHTPWCLLVWVRKSFRLLGSAWSWGWALLPLPPAS